MLRLNSNSFLSGIFQNGRKKTVYPLPSSAAERRLGEWLSIKGLPPQKVGNFIRFPSTLVSSFVLNERDPNGLTLINAAQVALSEGVPEGRGLVATQLVRRGEKLLSIPADLLLTADVALHKSAFGSRLESAGVPAWSALATFLAEIRRQPEMNGNDWATYVACLPSQTGCVLEWTPEEVNLSTGFACSACFS